MTHTAGCQLKIKFYYHWHFWSLDGIFEIKMIKKICLGVIRFEIGQSELDFLTCWNQLTLGALFSKSGQESCLFLLPWASLCPYLTQNIIGYPGMIFYWIQQMINPAEPSVNCFKPQQVGHGFKKMIIYVNSHKKTTFNMYSSN